MPGEDLKLEIDGLAQLNRGLRQIDAGAPKALRLALNEGAGLFASRVQPEIPVVTGAARRSVVARSTRTSARIAVGGKRAPWFPWLDFGGEGRRPGRPAHRPFLREGRYVYPTLRRVRPEIDQALQGALDAVIRDAGLQEG